MAWRLHLSDRTIKRLDILPGKPALLAAWTSVNRVTFLDLQNGTQVADRTLEDAPTADRTSQAWRNYVADLAAPNGVTLPQVRCGGTLISLAAEGGSRLYQTTPTDLFFESDGQETRLEVEPKTALHVAVLDRSGGLVAALDSEAKLHLYQGRMRVGVFETGLRVDAEYRPTLAVAQGALFLCDGSAVVRMGADGQVRKRLDLHYTVGAINCSSDGSRFVASDLDDNVLRVYDTDLRPTHQRHAVDLLAEARRSQLLASAAASSAALGPLAIANKGALAFALSGTLCVTSLARLKAHPRPTA
jgi:hypothetical protein